MSQEEAAAALIVGVEAPAALFQTPLSQTCRIRLSGPTPCEGVDRLSWRLCFAWNKVREPETAPFTVRQVFQRAVKEADRELENRCPR